MKKTATWIWQWIRNHKFDFLFLMVIIYLISQRIPNWLDLWKLQGRQAQNFSAIVLRPALQKEKRQLNNNQQIQDSDVDLKKNPDEKMNQIKNQTMNDSKTNSMNTNFAGHQRAILIPQELHKPAALIFWATWCGPCQIEISRVRELVAENKIKAEQVYLLSIAEDPELILKTATERNYPFHLLHDMNGDAFNFYKVRATPTTVFIDQAGKISWIGTGLSPTLGLRMEKHLNQ